MNTRRWERISSLFERAITLDEASRRELYALECADDTSLGDEVEHLVLADTDSRDFLALPVASLSATSESSIAAGTCVGGYTLIRRMAAGGMGIVFEARQERPNRRVALKLVQSALVDEVTLRRFRYEAEALGRLRHPGIAQVYEAGVDVGPNGEERPFLAMELVEGARPVTVFARESTLSFVERVRLLVEVCAAVQHGHERGVLHRDLKASNVLVDGSGTVKVIDFGIAKIQGEQQTRATLAGELVGTLASMSPEQLDGDLDEIDVRSDVFALGALAYEVLCGVPHVDLRGLSLTEALTRARNSTPAPPSSVRADLPLELEWIVMRALESERERRYASATDLARDLERFLRDEPVLASPPSTVYRLTKFVRRNRIVVTASCAILLAIIAGAIVALVQRDHALIAKARAEQAEGLAENRLARLEVEARTNRELAEFQRRILTSADPDIGGRDARVVDALALSSLDLDSKTELEPKIWLTLRRSLVDAYGALGLPNEAGEQIRRMRPVWEAEYAPDDPERLALELAQLDIDAYTAPAAERDQRARSGLARTIAHFGPESVEAARWELGLANARIELGELLEAETLARSALDVFRAGLGPVSRDALDASLILGRILNDARRYEEAEGLKRDTFDTCVAVYGEDHAVTLLAKKQLAVAIGQMDRPDEAIDMLREVIAAHERRTGRRSPHALTARADLAEFLRSALRAAESLVEIESALEDGRITFGERHPYMYRAAQRRASTLVALGRRVEAITELERVLALVTSELGADDATTIEIETSLVRNLFHSARFQAALPRARDAWERSKRRFGDDSATTLARGNDYAVVLAQLGHPAEAGEILQTMQPSQDRVLGPYHSSTLMNLVNLSTTYLKTRQLDVASCWAQELVARVRSSTKLGPTERAGAHWILACVQRELDDREGAAANFAIASECWSRSREATSKNAIKGLIDEAHSLDVLERHAEARAVLERAAVLACGSRITPDVTARAFTSLALSLRRTGELDAARELAEMTLAGSSAIEPEVRKLALGIVDPQ